MSLIEKRIALVQRTACIVHAQIGERIKIINASRSFAENNNATDNINKERDKITKRVFYFTENCSILRRVCSFVIRYVYCFIVIVFSSFVTYDEIPTECRLKSEKVESS